MKNPLLLFVLLGVVSLVSVGCEKEDDEFLKPLLALPDPPDPEDVGSAVKDPYFREYCYRMFDENKDGKISLYESFGVRTINMSGEEEAKQHVTSLEGIEYFPCLSSLKCSGFVKLVSVDLRYNKMIEELPPYSFSDCSKLRSIALPDGMKRIYDHAFCNCSSLLHVFIPESVTQMSFRVFENCTSLTYIDLPNDLELIDAGVFYNCSSLKKIVVPDGALAICSSAFERCSSLKEVVIPNSVGKIGYWAFGYCTSLTHIVLPDNMLWIDSSSFQGCSALTQIVIPDRVVGISFGAFERCSSLTEIVIPDRVRIIESNAFYGCSGLQYVVLPEACTSIEVEQVFRECSSSLTAVCKATVPPDAGAVSEAGRFHVLYVPAGSVEAYKSSNWGKLFRIVKPIR